MAAGRPKSAAALSVKNEPVEEKPQSEDGSAPKVLTKIKVTEGITVAELAQKLNVKAGVLIKEMLGS